MCRQWHSGVSVERRLSSRLRLGKLRVVFVQPPLSPIVGLVPKLLPNGLQSLDLVGSDKRVIDVLQLIKLRIRKWMKGSAT